MKLKEKRQIKISSGFINDNFSGSEHRLSFSNNLSMRDKDFALGESNVSSRKGGSGKRIHQGSSKVVSRR